MSLIGSDKKRTLSQPLTKISLQVLSSKKDIAQPSLPSLFRKGASSKKDIAQPSLPSLFRKGAILQIYRQAQPRPSCKTQIQAIYLSYYSRLMRKNRSNHQNSLGYHTFIWIFAVAVIIELHWPILLELRKSLLFSLNEYFGFQQTGPHSRSYFGVVNNVIDV